MNAALFGYGSGNRSPWRQKLIGWFGGGGINGTGAFFESIGFRPGSRFAVVAGLGEFLGGLLLAFGFLGPIGPALILILCIIGALTVAFAGTGQYSLDHVVGLDSALPPMVTGVVLAFGVLGALSSLALRHAPELAKSP